MSNELPLHVAAQGKCSFLLECGAIRSLSLSSFDRGHSLFQVLLTRWFVLLCCRCARAAMLDRRRFRLRSRHLEHTICVSCQKEVSRSGREGGPIGRHRPPSPSLFCRGYVKRGATNRYRIVFGLGAMQSIKRPSIPTAAARPPDRSIGMPNRRQFSPQT